MYSNLETLWRATAAKNPGSYLAHNDLGIILLNSGREAEAVPKFEKALAIRSDLAETHYNLGVALAEIGRRNDAIVHFETAARLNPDLAEVQNRIGLSFSGGNRFGEAISHYRAALQLKPDQSYRFHVLIEVQTGST